MDFRVYVMHSDFLYCIFKFLPMPERSSDFNLAHQASIEDIGVCVYMYIYIQTHKHIDMYAYIHTYTICMNTQGGN